MISGLLCQDTMLLGSSGFCLDPLLSPSKRDCVILQSHEMAIFLLSRVFRLASRRGACLGVDVSYYQHDNHVARKALWNCCFHCSRGSYLSACDKFWDLRFVQEHFVTYGFQRIFFYCSLSTINIKPSYLILKDRVFIYMAEYVGIRTTKPKKPYWPTSVQYLPLPLSEPFLA